MAKAADSNDSDEVDSPPPVPLELLPYISEELIINKAYRTAYNLASINSDVQVILEAALARYGPLKVFWTEVDQQVAISKFIGLPTIPCLEWLILPCARRSQSRFLQLEALPSIRGKIRQCKGIVYWSQGNVSYDGSAVPNSRAFMDDVNRLCVDIQQGNYECSAMDLLHMNTAIDILVSLSEGMGAHQTIAAEADIKTVYIYPKFSNTQRSVSNHQQHLTSQGLANFRLPYLNYVLDFGGQSAVGKEQLAWMNGIMAQTLAALSYTPSTDVTNRNATRSPPRRIVRGTETMQKKPLRNLLATISKTLELFPTCINVGMEFEIYVDPAIQLPDSQEALLLLRMVRWSFAFAIDKLKLWNRDVSPLPTPYIMLRFRRPSANDSITAVLNTYHNPSAPEERFLRSRTLRMTPAHLLGGISTEMYKSPH